MKHISRAMNKALNKEEKAGFSESMGRAEKEGAISASEKRALEKLFGLTGEKHKEE